MDILFKLTDKDIGMQGIEMKDYKTRIAARGIVINNSGKIAVQVKKNTREYKLIGGGLENDEKPEEGFKREVLEETGCDVTIIKELGITEEYISMKNAKQISYVFVGKVVNDTHKLHLTEKEKTEGSKLLWLEPKEALKLIKDSFNNLVSSTYTEEYDSYRMKFVILRDSKILEYYINSEE